MLVEDLSERRAQPTTALVDLDLVLVGAGDGQPEVDVLGRVAEIPPASPHLHPSEVVLQTVQESAAARTMSARCSMTLRGATIHPMRRPGKTTLEKVPA